jgi:hypothetical protein
MTFRQYRDGDDFVYNYPFAPYQFQLVQRIFEAIRKAGATELHLSRGERSILDAFQLAGKRVANQDVGVLVPLYDFYPSIESFLDTVVKVDEPVTNVETITFDSASGDMDERKKWVPLVLRDRPYDKSTPYRLVLQDLETGIEQSSVDVIIDRAFADDF